MPVSVGGSLFREIPISRTKEPPALNCVAHLPVKLRLPLSRPGERVGGGATVMPGTGCPVVGSSPSRPCLLLLASLLSRCLTRSWRRDDRAWPGIGWLDGLGHAPSVLPPPGLLQSCCLTSVVATRWRSGAGDWLAGRGRRSLHSDWCSLFSTHHGFCREGGANGDVVRSRR